MPQELTIANVDMAQAWDGEEGERWARDADRYDAAGTRIWGAFLDRRPVAVGDHVLDIGCGAGKSSLDSARLAAPSGQVLGVDLSSQMLDLARRRAASAGLSNVRFRQADAQVYPFDQGSFDVAISAFGTMFFADPVAAFSNFGRALRPGGRLAVMTWRSFAENEWIRALRDALAIGRQLGDPPMSMPGPFGLADPGHVRNVLEASGFTGIDLQPIDEPSYLGRDAEDAYAFVLTMGIVKGLTQDLDEADRDRALDAARQALVDHETPDGVIIGSASWLVTATRS